MSGQREHMAATVRRGRGFLWLLLLALFFGLARGGMRPARAQSGHVHHWLPGAAPKVDSYVLYHLDGSRLSPSNPAHRCEIIEVEAYIGHDTDTCDAPNCPLNGMASESGYALSPGSLGITVKAWKDDNDDRGEGHFLAPDPNNPGRWVLAEKYNGAEGRVIGGGGKICYYQIPSTQPDNIAIILTPQVDDTGMLSDGQTIIGGCDDDPAWAKSDEGTGVAPLGDLCNAVKTYVSTPPKCAVCEVRAQAKSEVVPETGNLSFSVPVTSWSYRGEQIPFSLTYNSFGHTDPTTAFHQPRHPAALSDDDLNHGYNPKWTHTFAQWVDLNMDGQAVWHMGDGRTMAFQAIGPGQWRSSDSYTTLRSNHSDITSPKFLNNWEERLGVVVHEADFWITDGEGTKYVFDQVQWNMADGPPHSQGPYAIPYYLLTSITDRTGRTLAVNWGTYGVATVRDGDGRGLIFGYDPVTRLLGSVQDPYGRVHTLGHGLAGGQQKLTYVTVEGPGDQQRVHHSWTFDYSVTAGYGGGPVTNDLITTKTEPSGLRVSYEYNAGPQTRNLPGDYDGVFHRAYWMEETGNGPVQREILRNGGTMVYPGGDTYTYASSYVTGAGSVRSVKHDVTGYVSYEALDELHNLTATWTNQESQQSPLVSMAYTFSSGNHIDAVTATDLLGNKASANLNALNLPTDVRALAALGSGHADQVTRFTYDYGLGLQQGRVTHVEAAYGTPSQQVTDLEYQDPHAPGSPTAVTDSVGARATATYLPNGLPSTVSSPQNLLAPVGDPDRAASISQVEYNADELPSRFTDPQGHQYTVGYNADPQLNSSLVVTYTNVADGSTRKVTLDAGGRVVRSVDENGVVSTAAYNVSGQPLTVTAAAGTAVERTVRYYYGSHQELTAFDPPAGSGARVTFDYVPYYTFYPGYPPQRSSQGQYVGLVTRVTYPDGSNVYCGYNDCEELTWRYDQNGGTTRVYRDSLHRVYQVDYPARAPYGGFSASVQYDEFGRVKQQSDASGVSSFSYDDLNRPVTVTPAVGRSVTYQYLPDATLQRWTTRATLAGVGAFEFREDTKGREAQVLNPLGQLTTRRFDPDGKLLRETRANGTYTDYTYTNRDWLAGMQHFAPNGTALDTLQYFYTDSSNVYDPSGRLRREVDAGGRTHAFSYNALGELTGESHPDFGTRLYTYDAAGNRTSKSVGSGTEWYGYDAQNKLLWSNQGTNAAPLSGQQAQYRRYTYDAAGNPTGIERGAAGTSATDLLQWDGMGKLRRYQVPGSQPVDYTAVYDADGLRVSSVMNGVQHVYSGGLYDEAGSTLYTPGVSQNKGGLDRYFSDDWLGSVRYLTDGLGASTTAYRYDAYGSISAQAGVDSSSVKFAGNTGYESDGPAGLLMLGERYYDPAVGRFISPDPIGFAGGFNLYEYCYSDPVNSIDPSGLLTWKDAGNGLINGGKAVLHGVGVVTKAVGDGIYNFVKPLWTPRGPIQAPTLGGAAIDHSWDDEPEVYASRRALRIGGRQAREFIDREGGEICGTVAFAAVGAVAGGGAATSCEAGGEFSVIDWSKYPEGAPRPTGPFRLLRGSEYAQARKAADAMNKALHRSRPELKGMEIHEIHPVKFGGHPTDLANKIALHPAAHREFSQWWKQMQRWIERGVK